MLTLAATSTPDEVAWAAFDAAAMTFQRMYQLADPMTDTEAERARRRAASLEVARLWDEWRTLFLADAPEPRPAA